MSGPQREMILGIDTHLDTHVGAIIDDLGRARGTMVVPTTSAGSAQLLTWARSLGPLKRAGVEGTGTYGASVARFLTAAGVEVIEVNRPNRARRRRLGKNDPTDAENAARAVLAGDATGTPKTHSGLVEALRGVMVARRSAVKARTQASNQLRSLIVTAPDDLRTELRSLPLAACMARCAAFRPNEAVSLLHVLKRTLRLLAMRWLHLSAELDDLNTTLTTLTHALAPRVLARHGVGPHTAATLLLTAGDNPGRLRNEAALAALCGVSPLEASSGRIVRHRLNRGGDRQANNALWTIALTRMRGDARTKAYVRKRTQEGRTLPEIRRCLKRYIVRELHPLLLADLGAVQTTPLT
jgi:transposase